jgi:hypothetical protein
VNFWAEKAAQEKTAGRRTFDDIVGRWERDGQILAKIRLRIHPLPPSTNLNCEAFDLIPTTHYREQDHKPNYWGMTAQRGIIHTATLLRHMIDYATPADDAAITIVLTDSSRSDYRGIRKSLPEGLLDAAYKHLNTRWWFDDWHHATSHRLPLDRYEWPHDDDYNPIKVTDPYDNFREIAQAVVNTNVLVQYVEDDEVKSRQRDMIDWHERRQREIADWFKQEELRKQRRAANPPKHGTRFYMCDDAMIVGLARAGFSIKEIADSIGRSAGAIRYRFHTLRRNHGTAEISRASEWLAAIKQWQDLK